MNKKLFFILFVLVPFLGIGQQTVSIIPQPVSLSVQKGNFIIDRNTSINFYTKENDLRHAANFLNAFIKNVSGDVLPINTKKSKSIILEIKKTATIGDEGYLLDVTPSNIKIIANTKTGIVYGMQSLFQTLPQIRTNAALEVPCMKILDYPRFKWRGMHLDVCRHFFGPDLVKEYIDLMAAYKFNTFHWHLTDDQGWRIQIKKYPKLTSVGGWRADRTGIPWDECQPTQPGEESNYGGYYTQQQIRDIVAYAKERNITIVPEIEMPGHSAAAIASYPWLSTTQKPQPTITGGVYPPGFQSVYDVSNDSVFTFLENVLTEVMQLFPSKYIHVGGDEVDKTPWKNSARCQELMKKLGDTSEDQLQSYFIERIEKFLIAHHRKLIGWDEILEGGLAPEATVMSWRGESGGIKAAQMHHDVVMTPGTPLYFDHYQAGPAGQPPAIGGFNTLKMVYDYNPIPKELDSTDARQNDSVGLAKYVLGAQANLWTEFIPTVQQVEYMVLPRMLALSEVVWSPEANKNYVDFYHRLQNQFKMFGEKGFNYCPGNFTVAIKPVSQDGKLLATLSSEIPGSAIYYTTDGSDPDAQSKKYENPISIDSSVTIKAVIVENGKVMGVKPAEQKFVMDKAVGKNVTFTYPVSKYYLADGPNSLTDGARGTDNVSKHWQGLDGNDLIATIDMGTETDVQKITIGCLQHYKDWIFLPQSVNYAVSNDGKNFTDLGTVKNTISPDDKGFIIKDFTLNFPSQKARYIRVTAKNLGVGPKGHPGEGKPVWIFADEIMVQ
ncbi:MAG TPA: family 20 glycosylhydrolase [Hanamia sp.]|nr:family 20 glycosylhydrolase [Hanamia sp.]